MILQLTCDENLRKLKRIGKEVQRDFNEISKGNVKEF